MRILKINKQNFHQLVKEVVKSIKNGQVVVCPTDTVYGLVCDTTNQKAINNLLKIKKRQAKKPIPIFVKDIKMAKKLAHIDKKQEEFLKKIWPGKATIVLNSKKRKNTIGLRIPNYQLILNLIKKLKLPLTGTSANISDKPASTRIREVLKYFKNQKYQPDLIIDAGNLKKSRPSTVIDLTILPPRILRY